MGSIAILRHTRLLKKDALIVVSYWSELTGGNYRTEELDPKRSWAQRVRPTEAHAGLSLNKGDRPWKIIPLQPLQTGNLRAVQLMLSHSKIESTVRYLGIEVDDAIEIAKKIEI